MADDLVDDEAGDESEGEGDDLRDSSEEEEEEDDEEKLRKEGAGWLADENEDEGSDGSDYDIAPEESEAEKKRKKKKRRRRGALFAPDEDDLDLIEENTVRLECQIRPHSMRWVTATSQGSVLCRSGAVDR